MKTTFTDPIIILFIATFCISFINATDFTIQNKCTSPVNILSSSTQGKNPIDTSTPIAPGKDLKVSTDSNWAGNFAANNNPGSIVEFTLNRWKGSDYFDINISDGFSLPVSIQPSGGCEGLTCATASCTDAYTPSQASENMSSCKGGTQYTIVYCPAS